ncbi:MAG: sulfatase-like hydrolase/transferase [Lunatimonas sp.]|uniref:sulfatase-like hydrolase/transferase n=1 Tax=Lunatimonas sp. TaxID=2060141 RepID=UPI00263AB4CF|nr:sulfatase-like hydrolase/transferase [Lunatimonas sp.]MCC5938258.1 sulfatase-like hydrolase/transferase [Lunatimonas sp.]
MNYRNIKYYLVRPLLMGLIFLLTNCKEYERQVKKPNIVFVLADDMRWDYLGAIGANKIVQTPNLDKLAAKGTLFSNAFVTSAICTPSRTSILTGMYERKHGVTFGSNSVMTEEAFAQTYPMLLRENGYYTGWVGKNHTPVGKSEKGLGYKSGVMEESFDYWRAGHGHLSFYPKNVHDIFKDAKADNQIDIIQEAVDEFLSIDEALETYQSFLRTRPTDQPFCLMINFNVPHSNGTNSMKQLPDDPELYRSAYRDQIDQIPLPADYVAYDSIQTPKLPPHVYNGQYLPSYNWTKTAKSLKENQIRTIQTVTGIDQVVGKIVEELSRQGILDNTIIVFTSDHGLFHGEYGLAGKTFLYDIDLKIPMIIYAPGLSNGRVVDEIALNIDIAPTLLDFAGIEMHSDMQGKSLKPILENANKDWRKDFCSENLFMEQNYPRMEAVRSKDWKYIRYYSKEKDQRHVLSLIAPFMGEEPIYEELFDLQQDPYERINLADHEDKQVVLEKLRRRCAELLIEAKGDNQLPKTYISDFEDRGFKDSVELIYARLDFD